MSSCLIHVSPNNVQVSYLRARKNLKVQPSCQTTTLPPGRLHAKPPYTDLSLFSFLFVSLSFWDLWRNRPLDLKLKSLFCTNREMIHEPRAFSLRICQSFRSFYQIFFPSPFPVLEKWNREWGASLLRFLRRGFPTFLNCFDGLELVIL